MPTIKDRPKKPSRPKVEINRGGGQPSNGVQKATGTENLNAGSTHSAKPWNLDGNGVVIKTRG